MDETPAFPEIDRCLLIHDNRHEDEGASDIELVLFFWPNYVDLSNQIALLGACSWVKAFSQSFTGSPVRVFEMKRFKLAMRSIGNVNLVLTAGHHYSRKSLETQLDHVVKAFEFYHLSPENIEQRAIAKIGPDLAAEETERGVISPLRQAIINEYQDAGMLLVPMVQAFHSSLAKNFHPLQYSHYLGNYPNVGNSSTSRLLSKASSLIWSASSLDEFISGCILDNLGNIIATHVDIDTTRWISNFIFADPARLTSDMVVYLKTSRVALLQDQKRDFFRAKHEFSDQIDQSQYYGTGAVEAPSKPSEEPMPVRLLFLHRPRLTICMLAMTQVQPFNAFHRLDSLGSEISALEVSIARIEANSTSPSGTTTTAVTNNSSQSLSGMQNSDSASSMNNTSAPSFASSMQSPIRSSSGSSSPAVSVPGTPPPGAMQSPSGLASTSNPSAASPVLSVSIRTLSRGLPASPRGTETSGSFPAHLRSSASSGHASQSSSSNSVAKTQNYNYLSFSEEAHTQEGIIGIRKPDAERLFFESISFVHDTFNESPHISKIAYRDQQGTLFCRKLFGKETYFQQLAAGNQTRFANFEERARELLSSEHSVYLI